MFHSKRQIQRARKARNLHQMMGHPSAADYKTAIKCDHVKNCPVTIKDIKIAEDVFRKDICVSKGKTV